MKINNCLCAQLTWGHRKTYRYDFLAGDLRRECYYCRSQGKRTSGAPKSAGSTVHTGSHYSSGNPCLKKTTTGTSKVRLSYVALSITSTRCLTLRSAKRATTGKTCSTRTITKQVRPVVTEALEIFKSLSHNCLCERCRLYQIWSWTCMYNPQRIKWNWLLDIWEINDKILSNTRFFQYEWWGDTLCTKNKSKDTH